VSKVGVRKKTLFISILFLLSLFLLPILPITAPKPSPQKSVNVQLAGDITSLPMTFDVDVQRGGKTVIVHSAYESTVDLTFVDTGDDLWRVNSDLDFAGGRNGKLAFSVDQNSNSAFVVFNFGRYTDDDVADGVIVDRYVGWLKYQLTGPGQWIGEDISDGSVSTDAEEFNICQIFYTPAGKGKGNSASGLSFVEVWSGVLTFDIVINPLF
jgi:hypothetical protein